MVRQPRRVTLSARLAGVVATVVAMSLATACSGGLGVQWRSPGSGPSAAPVSHLALSPAADAKNVSPADPVTVDLTNGRLETVTLVNSVGKAVKGQFDEAMRTWSNAEQLGYNKQYKLTVKGIGDDGKVYDESLSFTTVKPANLTMPYLRANVGMLLNRGTFGVGQPVVIWFDEPIKDRAAAERTLSVTSVPPVIGGWRWMDNQEVHWRPQVYWPAGTKVTVEAKVYGRDLGNGLYGQEDVTADFTIGPSKIAIADSTTHRMKVYIDGAQVTKLPNGKDITAGIPISMGKGGTEVGGNGVVVDYWTRTGPHVITLKYEEYRMTSASFGIDDPSSPNYYDVKIKKSIRISGGGEFVHLADWNIWAHGKTNTSHGCINVAPAYIYWFYDTFGAGDIVDVRNTPKKLDVRDGLGDWVLSWEDWQKGSALS